MHSDQPRAVSAGTHVLHVHSRTAGTKIRTVGINANDNSGVCGWTSIVPAALRLPAVQLASHGKVVAPMMIANRGEVSATNEVMEFVWAPDSAVERGCAIDPAAAQYRPQGATCGRIEMTFVCDIASEVSFSYEILAPSGNDDSFYIALETDCLGGGRNAGQCGNAGPYRTPQTWHAGTTPVSATTQCVAAGGIPNGNVCCDAGCGVCGGSSCGDRPGGPGSCCSGTITEASTPCGGAAAGLPPCLMPEPWEWHVPLVGTDGTTLTSHGDHPLQVYHVQPGLHKLILHQREDGAKVRRIRFENRGSCGFAPDAQLPDHVPVAFAEVRKNDEFWHLKRGIVYQKRGNLY